MLMGHHWLYMPDLKENIFSNLINHNFFVSFHVPDFYFSGAYYGHLLTGHITP